MRKAFLLLSATVLAGAILSAQLTWAPRSAIRSVAPGVQTVSTQRTGAVPSVFSAERLARIDRVLQQYVDEGRIGGIVALVLRDGKSVYERAIGWSDKEAGRRMATDTIFRIASQTKAKGVSTSLR